MGLVQQAGEHPSEVSALSFWMSTDAACTPTSLNTYLLML